MTDLRELRRLEPLFWRAPSAHNTQPWTLEYARDRIALGVDPSRRLPAGDPTGRDLELGLGAFVEAVLVAAASEGVGLVFDGSGFVPGPSYDTPFGRDDLVRRQTSRLPYPQGLAGSELAAARSAAGDGVGLAEIPARELRDLFLVADRHVYESPAVVAELRRWLRLNRRHPEYERDGLTYETLAVSRPEAAALALVLRPAPLRLLRMLRLHGALASASAKVLETGSVLVLHSDGDALAAGRSLMRAWLALAAAGCHTHPLSQLIDFEPTERELARRVGVESPQRILSVFRAGRSAAPARSPRLRG